ncbi:hypothetical protein SJ_257 [Proteus phage SJ_PmiM]|nr:hypothetical protein SJ_257 [Proteus phage SJ_PmiM]
MIQTTTFKKLKTDTMFEFATSFYVKLTKTTARKVGSGEVYKFDGHEEVIADSARIKKWYNF